MLFTDKEKHDVYRRIVNCGHNIGDNRLSHVIKDSPKTIKTHIEVGGSVENTNRLIALYRLVTRGMIVTYDQYIEKGKILLGK